MEITVIIIVYSHSSFFLSTVFGYLHLIFHFIFMVSFFGGLVSFCHIFTLANVIFTTFLKCLFVKLKLNISILRCALQHSDWNLLHSFKKAQVEMLKLVAQINLYSSKMLFGYLILHIPMNAYVLNLYIHGHVTGKNILLLGVLVLSQFNGIFGIHLFAAELSGSELNTISNNLAKQKTFNKIVVVGQCS